MAVPMMLTGLNALSTPPLKGDRMLDGSRDFPWLNLAQVWQANPSVYNTTASLHEKVDEFLSGSCAANGVQISREPVPSDLENTRAADVRVLRLTGDGAVSHNRTKVMINLGIHGREYITGEVALHLLNQLCDGSPRSRALLNETEFMIIPLLNVAGREKVETSTASCSSMRKNENDVDLNRNFAFVWDQGSDEPTQEDYRGSAAMSEPESRLLNHTVANFAPSMFIDVHSGDQSLMYPYSYREEGCANSQDHQNLLDHVNNEVFCNAGLPFNDPTQKVFRNTCGVRAGPAAQALSPPYTASGTTLDYMYEVLHVPYAMTWEVYSGTRFAQQMAAAAHANAKGTNLAHHTQLLATHTADSSRYNAVVPHPGASASAHKPLAPHSLMPGGARPAPAANPVMPDMTQSDCFAYFNPTNVDDMLKVASTWAESLVTGSEYLNAHLRGKSLSGAVTAKAKAGKGSVVL